MANMNLTTEQAAATLYRLLANGVINETHLLSDFTNALERALEENLMCLNEPVFRNPTTGKQASSANAILIALGYIYSPPWAFLVQHFVRNGGSSVFMRRDLPKANPRFPTVCVDLDAAERLVLGLQPRKAPKVIAAFRAANNCA
ncbi:hypothetical protein UFOVP347_4 [uncultured Caudovirales phage]|uniref:Uncharacterized protein n=1 Tax=uncultured Caudovirales phage TaxID=2100421 RepID=A0A6J5LXE8_9CAUD|nr:hypothetical protein UFOVP347_4 [uncultured Caudovirales phage]